MSEQVGKLLECDRCGKTVFLKRTGEYVADGGYVRKDTYEDRPEGWLYETRVGHLCPVCAEKYINLLAELMEGGKK